MVFYCFYFIIYTFVNYSSGIGRQYKDLKLSHFLTLKIILKLIWRAIQILIVVSAHRLLYFLLFLWRQKLQYISHLVEYLNVKFTRLWLSCCLFTLLHTYLIMMYAHCLLLHNHMFFDSCMDLFVWQRWQKTVQNTTIAVKFFYS